jgi:hypothetical protein
MRRLASGGRTAPEKPYQAFVAALGLFSQATLFAAALLAGDLEGRAAALMARTKFEATPLFVDDSFIFRSPFKAAITSNPGTGE